MNLLNEKLNNKKSRKNFFRIILLECLILSLLLSWQYYNNREILKILEEEQEIIQESIGNSKYIEKVYYGNRKKVLEAFEVIQMNQKKVNNTRHQAMYNALENILEVTKDPYIDLESIYVEETLVEIKGSATKKSVIDKHFADLSLPHYGKFEPLEYNNYTQDRYQFILRNHLLNKGGT